MMMVVMMMVMEVGMMKMLMIMMVNVMIAIHQTPTIVIPPKQTKRSKKGNNKEIILTALSPFSISIIIINKSINQSFRKTIYIYWHKCSKSEEEQNFATIADV